MTFELTLSLTFFTTNNAPYGAQWQTQDPLFQLEGRITRNLNSAVWISIDGNYVYGARTFTNGVDDANARMSVALSIVKTQDSLPFQPTRVDRPAATGPRDNRRLTTAAMLVLAGEPLSGNEEPRFTVRQHSRIEGSIGRRPSMLIRFAQQRENKGAESPVDVLYSINSHGTAENPAHIGLDRHADDLDALLCLDEGDNVAKMAHSKIAYVITLLAHVGPAGVSIGNDEHDPALGATLLQPLVAPHDGFTVVTDRKSVV
jgi:hypothetical protein